MVGGSAYVITQCSLVLFLLLWVGCMHRFTRNANLVAAGVMKNLKRVGNYVKEHLDDSLDDHRKRPK